MVDISFEAQHKKSFISFCVYLFVSICGLLAGLLLLAGDRGDTISASALICSAPTFYALVLSVFLPFIIVFLLWKSDRPIELFALIAVKSASFSYCVGTVFAVFPHSGWLVQLLILFTQWAEMCVFHFLWMHILVFKSLNIRLVFRISIVALTVCILLEYFIICPFTASLFIHK